MEVFELMVLMPFWLIAIFILGFFTLLGLMFALLYWARGPAWALVTARISKRLPILYRLGTGQIGIRLAKATPQYFEIGKFKPAFLPTIDQSKGKPDFWESVRQPCYFVDERKTLAFTLDDVALFNEADPKKKQEQPEANPIERKVSPVEALILDQITSQLAENKKVDVAVFKRLSFEQIQEYISDKWNESVVGAFGRQCEYRGRKSAGFNMAGFSILIGIAMLFMVLAIVAKWVGVF